MSKFITWKIIVPAILIIVMGMFGYNKYLEFKFGHKQEIDKLNQELAARDIELNKARTEIVNSVDIRNAVTKLQSDYIKQKKLLAQQHAEIVALYASTGGGDATPSENSPELNKKSVVKVDDKVVKNWVLKYKDFRIDIDTNVLEQKTNYALHQSFKIDLVKTVNDYGGVAFFANAYELDNTTGKVVGELQIKEFNVKEVKPNSKKLRWFGAPLQVGLNGGYSGGEITPQVFVSYPIASYGYTTVDTTWVIGPYGGSNGDTHSAGLYFGYDVGEMLNINLFRGVKTGPMIGYSTDGMFVGVGISK